VAEWDVPGYTELKALGSGGFGEVVLARHDSSGTRVAIKYLRRELLADPEFAAMFRGEAEVLASVEDPNVVRLYEYVQSLSGAAIVMELIDGVSLREILARHGQTTPEAALVVLQGSLLGLAAAHARGVVHRDYKPENVLIDGAGASKLTDFGIAARAGDRAMAAGTLAYAPPEQFGGGPASPSGDVYAATATFYECLTGHPPFSGDSAERLLYQHLAEPVPLEPVPEPLRPLVVTGLAKDPADRPADGAALVAELRAVAGGAYGPGWEDRGRSGLAAAALLLAALWPLGGPPAAQGSTVRRVRLRRRLPHGHVATVKAAVTAGLAIAVAGAVAAAVIVARPTGHTAPPPAPARAAASLSVDGALEAVAATSASDAWAVGFDGSGNTLIEHWNGTGWKREPSPSPGPSGVYAGGRLVAVAATSATNAWAVGGTNSGQSLILHWNGTSWRQVPSPGTSASLGGVTAISAGNAWAVGSAAGKTLILHWNGTAWQQASSPSVTGALEAVAATSASNAWAVGLAATSFGTAEAGNPLIMHWNGAAWERVSSNLPPGIGNLRGVAATSAGNAWAVGCSGCLAEGAGAPLIERWNGTRWTQVSALTYDALAGLNGVTATSATNAWAVGIPDGVPGHTTGIAHWNGHTWELVPSPNPGGQVHVIGVAATSAGNAWAVGETEATTPFMGVISHWNGQMWSGPAGQSSPAAAPASSTAPAAVSSPAPSAVSSPAPSAPPPTQVNIQGVTIGISAVNTDLDAMDVAATLAAYFGGIDARNYQQAWDTYTPALQEAVSFQTFSRLLSTSQDTQIVVQSIQHDPDGDLDVQVGFQSHQAGQYGPEPGETCTNWSLDYHLVASAGAQPSAAASPSYLISKVTDVGAGHASC
jgi:eukaryotic-like serine/threonine-protein kinase